MRRYADAAPHSSHAHTRTAHPFLPDLHRSIAYPNHRSNPPRQTPTGVPRLQGIRARRPRLVRQVPTNDRPAQAPAPKPGVPRRVLSRQRPEEGQGCQAGSLHVHGATRDRVAGRQRRGHVRRHDRRSPRGIPKLLACIKAGRDVTRGQRPMRRSYYQIRCRAGRIPI